MFLLFQILTFCFNIGAIKLQNIKQNTEMNANNVEKRKIDAEIRGEKILLFLIPKKVLFLKKTFFAQILSPRQIEIYLNVDYEYLKRQRKGKRKIEIEGEKGKEKDRERERERVMQT